MKNKIRKVTARERHRITAAQAMPQVKALVTKYGSRAVGSCLNKIKARDKELKRLDAMKAELARREAALR